MKKVFGLEGELGCWGFTWRYIVGKAVAMYGTIAAVLWLDAGLSSLWVNVLALVVEVLLLVGVFMRRLRQIGVERLWWTYPAAGVVYVAGEETGLVLFQLAGGFWWLVLVLGCMFSKGKKG